MKRTLALLLALVMLTGIVSAIPDTTPPIELPPSGLPDVPSMPASKCGSSMPELGPLGYLLQGVGCMSTPTCWSGKNVVIPLVQKDPTTWEVIPNGAKGKAHGSMGKFWTVDAFKLKPTTAYTFIYYGDATNNDIWPYATCIKSGKTNKKGMLSLYGKFDYSSMKHDGKDQKFWVILSSDVDCATGKMIAWNPTEYLFETKTL